jgi:serine/threonine protein kinase
VSECSPTEEFGPYIVYEQLGVGGMAQVHRAIATSGEFPRPVALKRMLSHIASSKEMVKSFVREARLASYLRHENVPRTYDLGRVGEIYFIVMELISGRNLREVLRHCGSTTGPMPVQIALNILNQICDALDYAHNLCDETGQPLGIIHRDVSPSNVLVSDRGVVKLIDFGIAKTSGGGMQTMGDTLKGKFGYMAPEYIAGDIDARADLFAVGVIAHELLTNRPLFSGRDDIDTLTRVREMHIDPPSKQNPRVPPEIDDIVMTALARDPDGRWQHATALRTALTTLTRRLDLVATPAQVVQWLDWAFTQSAKQPPRAAAAAAADTETETDAISDEPSISIEQQTLDLSTMCQNVTLPTRDDAPAAPVAPVAPVDEPLGTPLGTPGSVPTQRPGMPALVADHAAAADRPSRHNEDAPRATAAVSPMARPSARPAAAPVFPAVPFAVPRPLPRSPAARLPCDPARSARVARDFAQRISAPSITAVVPARSSHRLAVVLVVLAAAITAITVYFVLPLLT